MRLGRIDIKAINVDLNAIINKVIEQFKPDYINRNIEWRIKSLPQAKSDPNLLKIVFENLISNVVKYTAKKESAIIEIGEFSTKLPNQIGIFIKVNGAGFDMLYIDKLFGVFQRLHRSEDFEGVGIGLANVKQIIFKHGGTIDAKSEIGNGATFFITLPEISSLT